MDSGNAVLRKTAATLARQAAAEGIFVAFELSGDSLFVRLPIMGSVISVKAFAVGEEFAVGYAARTAAGVQWLNDSFVTHCVVLPDAQGSPTLVIESKISFARLLPAIEEAARFALSIRSQEERGSFDEGNTVALHWYAAKLNFGDAIGPLLTAAYTGRRPVQANRPGLVGRSLCSVGSILGMFNQHNVDVWGSGLMRPLTKSEVAVRSRLRGIKIHAVRGKLTRDELIKSLGWEVPEVYGDPGLLLPDVILPTEVRHGNVAVVPHYVHLPNILTTDINVEMVDVRADVRRVVEQISGASAVVSSSLHGLIVAQAYGVPWVWLDVTDHPLGGGHFKFEDFFSTLDSALVARVEVSKDQLGELDFAELAQRASLPRLTIDLGELRAAFPVPLAAKPITGLEFPSVARVEP